jgi:hypothetical protein
MTTPSHLPTFIIGGAPRAGTTYLTEALSRHPEVYMARPFVPEPKVFMGPRQPLEVYHERYRGFFSGGGDRPARGEKTSHYLGCAQSCELIRQVVPDVRLLFIVREPVARAYSNYLQTKKRGYETLSFEDAVLLEGRRPCPLPPEQAYARPHDYLTRGDYATYAQRYFETYGRDRVLFVIHEDIARRPRRLWKDVQAFLGVTEVPFERLDVGVVNSAKEVGPPINPDTERRLREHMRPLVRHFAAVSGLDLEPWGYAA